jgi:16S rRNA C967 or C1407 C5-methylase (RsmB/RsmF family)
MQMETTFKTMRGRYVEIGGVAVKENIVKAVEWCEGSWELAADASTLSHSEGLKPLHRFLLREVTLGHLVRQELASMIPALLLDIKSHHNVLDMCAAPGSKTMQLLSLMHSDSVRNNTVPTGMVVANDADPKRISTLQTRIGMNPNLLITCCRAEDLQKCIGTSAFDRIVCDVPCSGDGTFRKFPHLWRLFRYIEPSTKAHISAAYHVCVYMSFALGRAWELNCTGKIPVCVCCSYMWLHELYV